MCDTVLSFLANYNILIEVKAMEKKYIHIVETLIVKNTDQEKLVAKFKVMLKRINQISITDITMQLFRFPVDYDYKLTIKNQ